MNLSGEAAYRPFRPPPLPPVALDGEMVALIAGAHRSLGELDAVAGALAEPDLLVSMYVRKEALMSAQIEGTQCTLDDILDPQAGAAALEDADVADVVNYVAAVRFAVGRLADLPICWRLLREAHEILTAGIRGGGGGQAAWRVPPLAELDRPGRRQALRRALRPSGPRRHVRCVLRPRALHQRRRRHSCTISSRRSTRSSTATAASDGCLSCSV